VCLSAVIVLENLVHPVLAAAFGSAFGLSGPAELAVVVSAALPTPQNVFGYAVRFDTGVALARDAALLTTFLSVPMVLIVAL